MLLLAIFYSRDKPLMNMYLRPIIDNINEMYKEGMCVSRIILWYTNTCSRCICYIYTSCTGIVVRTTSGNFRARAILLNFSCDLPARAIVVNMKQWNGVHGCLYCEDPGTTIGNDHLHRYWPFSPRSRQRTHTSLLKNAEDATKSAATVSA